MPWQQMKLQKPFLAPRPQRALQKFKGFCKCLRRNAYYICTIGSQSNSSDALAQVQKPSTKQKWERKCIGYGRYQKMAVFSK